MAIAENRGSGRQIMNLKSAIESALDEGGRGVALATGEARTGEKVVPAQSAVASVVSHGVSNEVLASPTLQTAEIRLTNALQHIYESTETKVLDALKQAAIDIIEHLGKQAAIQLVAAERRSAVLEQELKNTRSQALDMLVRLKYSAHAQRVEDERRVLFERRRALEADAELLNVQETVKRTKAELERKTEMLEDLQKRVQLDDAGALESASEGLDRRKRGSRTKDKVEQLSEHFVTLPGTKVSTAAVSAALEYGDAPLLDVDTREDIALEPSSRGRLWSGKRAVGSDGSADCDAVGSLSCDNAGETMTREVLAGTQVGSWVDKVATKPELQGIEQLLEGVDRKGDFRASNSSGGMTGHHDQAAEESRNAMEPVYGARKDFQRMGNGDYCQQLLDESILECREPGIYSSERPSHSGGHQAQPQGGNQDCPSLMCLEQGDGYGGLVVSDGEADRRTASSPASSSRQKFSPSSVSRELALVAEQESGNKPGPRAAGKRKRKVAPENEVKRVENMDSGQTAGLCSEDITGRVTESSRESRRLMQGARQLFSLRRGRDAD